MSEPRPAAVGVARAEWAAAWPLPFVGMLGLAAGSMFNFSAGVLMGDMTHAFGWSRAQFSLGVTLAIWFVLCLAPVVGWVVQRIGPRRAGLYGVWFFLLGFSALGLANGQIWQWVLLCVVQGIGVNCVSPSIWLTAVVGRFSVSRGLALAVVLAGLGVASAVWPISAAFYRHLLGWRLTFAALAASWTVVVWPLAYFFLYGAGEMRSRKSPVAPDRPRSRQAASTGAELTVWQALRSRTMILLVLANSMYALISLGINLHLVPILQSAGFSLIAAAGIASLAGLATLLGRIAVGFLLDHAPARLVGVGIFLLPATAALVLLTQPRGSLPMATAAAMLFGLGAGGEMDLLTYLASRYVPTRLFAPVYAIVLSVMSAAASFGPLVAGAVFDRTGSYRDYLTIVIPVVVVGALLTLLLPKDAHGRSHLK